MDGRETAFLPKNVLVVDDDAALRLLYRVNLELDGHLVHEAATLAEGRALLERQVPDVVLLDLRLGVEDGLELLDEIEALDLHTRVVLLSGSDEIAPSLHERVDCVLGKPFELERLAAAVADYSVR
jgi:two-component system KDP operon response regulator KdpE